MYYTLGQRRGLGIGGVRDARDAPWFVIAKDAARNRLIAAQDSEHALLMTREIVTSAPFHWIGRTATPNEPLQARISHRQALQDCTAETLADGRVRIRFLQEPRAAVAGQYAVLRSEKRRVGK